MVTLYELAVLSDDAYSDHDFESSSRLGWNRLDEIDNKGFEAKLYVKNNLSVIAFRGTEITSANDWLIDAKHLFSRNSSYVRQAISFCKKHSLRSNKILTGHSLGGFLAITMAMYFPSKIVAFNPPFIWGVQSAMLDRHNSMSNKNFMNSKIHVFGTNKDWLTKWTRKYGGYQTNNVTYDYASLLNSGHGLKSIIDYLDFNGRELMHFKK